MCAEAGVGQCRGWLGGRRNVATGECDVAGEVWVVRHVGGAVVGLSRHMPVPDQIVAMAALEKGAPVVQYAYPAKPLSKNDVDIRVLYNGVCATDVHMIDNDWGMSVYPLVPGHEICGEVVGTGSDVKNFKVGDIVALGCLAQSCRQCKLCEGGKRDNLCAGRVLTYMGSTKDETGEHRHYGGFSSFIRTDGRYLFHVPAGYPPEYVGPLMCAGATVAAPLYEYCHDSFDATGKTIGVIGLGGLGHLAIMFASKMGATVVALSRGQAKKQFAMDLGATSFIDSQDKDQMAAAAGTIDMLLVCQSGGTFDVAQYIGLLRAYGVLHLVGVPEGNLTVPVIPMVFGRLTISASPIGSSTQVQAMLDFAAAKNIRPMIEVFPHSQANEAIKKIKDNTIRFRAVLKNDLA